MPGRLSFALRGLEFDVRMPQGIAHVKSKLVGRPNVYNILAAVGTTAAVGIPIEAIEQGLQTLSGVPGRFELVSSTRDDITVVVDYAHTDHALRRRGCCARGAGRAPREVAGWVSALRLTVGWLAAAVAGRIVSGDPEQVVGNVVTDSRSLLADDFFVALRGPRFDGHAFVDEAIARGASGALVGLGAGQRAGLEKRPLPAR